MENLTKIRGRLSSGVIALLSITCPGLGHVFAGQMRRGLFFLFGIIILLAITGFSGLMNSFYGAAIIYLTLILTLIYMIADAYRLNSNKNGIYFKNYSKWYLYILYAIFSHVLANFSALSSGYRHYRILASSSDPTLKRGNVLLAKMNYGLPVGFHMTTILYRSRPIFIFHTPKLKIGSYILFYKLNEKPRTKIYIRKIFALGSSKFQIKNNNIYLNNQLNFKLTRYLQKDSTFVKRNPLPIHIPANMVLVKMNAAPNSSSVNQQFSLVPIKNIQGKATLILWSHDKTRIGNKLK